MSPKSNKAANKENSATTVHVNGKGTTIDPATTAAAPSSAVKTEARDVGSTIGKPDQAAYNAEQDKIKAEIDAIQAQLVCQPL